MSDFSLGFKAGIEAACNHWFNGVGGKRQLLPQTQAELRSIPCPSAAAAALAVPEVRVLVEAVSRFEELMQTQMRTADYHGEGCKCIRCAEDAMFAALAALRGENGNG